MVFTSGTTLENSQRGETLYLPDVWQGIHGEVQLKDAHDCSYENQLTALSKKSFWSHFEAAKFTVCSYYESSMKKTNQ